MITILNDNQRRALDFIAAANYGKTTPTVAQVEEWRLRPDVQPGEQGELIEPERRELIAETGLASVFETPALRDLASNLAVQNANNIAAVVQSMNLLGKLGQSAIGHRYRIIPAKYAPDGPPESFIGHLVRLEWVRLSDTGGLTVTALGRALMAADDSAGSDSSESAVILSAGDAMAYAQVITTLVAHDGTYVIDPWLGAEDLLQLLNATAVTRILIGPKVGHDTIAGMKVLLATHTDRLVELRQAPAKTIHDRYLLGDLGAHLVGGSLNNVGKTTNTVMAKLPPEVADSVGQLADEWWAASKCVGTSVGPATVETVADDPSDGSALATPVAANGARSSASAAKKAAPSKKSAGRQRRKGSTPEQKK